MAYSDKFQKLSEHQSTKEGYSENNFSLDPISESSIQNVIINMDSCKAYQTDNIPQILKDNVDKKIERLRKINYRPVSILPTLSKVYEKLLY